MSGDENDDRPRAARPDQLAGPRAVQTGHPYVEQHELGLEPLQDIEGLFAGCDRPDELESLRLDDHVPDRSSGLGAIVHDEYTDPIFVDPRSRRGG